MICITLYGSIDPINPLNIDEGGFQMTPVTLRNGPRSNGWYVRKVMRNMIICTSEPNPLDYTFWTILWMVPYLTWGRF